MIKKKVLLEPWEYLQCLSGLEILRRESRKGSRYILRRLDGQLVAVQVVSGSRDSNSVTFTVHRLQEDDYPCYWYAFCMPVYGRFVLLTRREIRERFLSKGKAVPERATISISREVAEQCRYENRLSELRRV